MSAASAVHSLEPAASVDFTAKEVKHVRAALRFLHLRCGAWETLGKALRFNSTALCAYAGGHKPVSAKLAVRISRFAGVGVDDVLTGKFPAPGTCPHCGHVSREAAE